MLLLWGHHLISNTDLSTWWRYQKWHHDVVHKITQSGDRSCPRDGSSNVMTSSSFLSWPDDRRHVTAAACCCIGGAKFRDLVSALVIRAPCCSKHGDNLSLASIRWTRWRPVVSVARTDKRMPNESGERKLGDEMYFPRHNSHLAKDFLFTLETSNRHFGHFIQSYWSAHRYCIWSKQFSCASYQ